MTQLLFTEDIVQYLTRLIQTKFSVNEKNKKEKLIGVTILEACSRG